MTEQESPGSESSQASAEGSSEGSADEAADVSDAAPSSDGDAGRVGVEDDVDLEDEVDETLVERVESSSPEAIAREIAALRVEVEGMEAELTENAETIDELESKLARARADFKNYKQRTEQRAQEERERATADLVERLLGVHDNLQRALEQDEDVDIRGGVESTLQQFDDVLAAENVTPIEPAPGADVDPHRHEVLVRVESEQPEGTIDEVHRVGYEMGETIVREAQVTVSDGSGSDGGDAGDEADGESGDEDGESNNADGSTDE